MKALNSSQILKGSYVKALWYILVFGWAVFRSIIVKNYFGPHGVSSLGYLIIDLVSSIPYARYSHRLGVDWIDKDWKQFKRSSFLACIFFYLPDFYILIFAKRVPSGLYFWLAIYTIFFSCIAVYGIRKQLK